MKKSISKITAAFIAAASLATVAPAFAQTGGGSGASGGTTGGSDTTTTQQRSDNRDWGWIGLLGLLGLMGMRKHNDRHDAPRNMSGRPV